MWRPLGDFVLLVTAYAGTLVGGATAESITTIATDEQNPLIKCLRDIPLYGPLESVTWHAQFSPLAVRETRLAAWPLGET
jgi:hypothetical protein